MLSTMTLFSRPNAAVCYIAASADERAFVLVTRSPPCAAGTNVKHKMFQHLRVFEVDEVVYQLLGDFGWGVEVAAVNLVDDTPYVSQRHAIRRMTWPPVRYDMTLEACEEQHRFIHQVLVDLLLRERMWRSRRWLKAPLRLHFG